MPSSASVPATRFDTIDILRGLSILAVVLLHISNLFSYKDLTLRSVLSPWWNHLLLQQGGNGVTVFFAISGFLITYTSIQRFGGLANLSPKVFYRIRFARIAPLLLLLLAVLSVLHLAHVPSFTIRPAVGHLPGAVLSVLTFTYNWYEARYGWLPACWTVLWSLSIEEMFYLFFPITCVVLLRGRYGLWLWTTMLLAFIVMAPFGRTVWNANDHARENSYVGGMGPIALGCLTALLTAHLQQRLPGRRVLLTVEGIGLLLTAWMIDWPRWHWLWPFMHRIAIADIDDFILPAGICLLMLGSTLRTMAHPPRTRSFVSRLTAPIRWFGRHSYEVYLSHVFLIIGGVELYLFLVKSHDPGPLALWFVGILLLTAPLGYLLARFISEPLNRKLRPRRSLQSS